MKRLLLIIAFIISYFLFVNSLVLAEENLTTTVSVDLIGFNSTSIDEINIEVPDNIDLGEVSKTNPVSDEYSLYINNTGIKNIRVTPQLKDSEEEIFKNLYFRKQKTTSTNDTSLITFYRIGSYYLDIDKPLTGKTFRAGHCYMQLNLTDFSGRITEDIHDYKTEIMFIATEI